MAKIHHKLYRKTIPITVIPMVMNETRDHRHQTPERMVICGGNRGPSFGIFRNKVTTWTVGVKWLESKKSLWRLIGNKFLVDSHSELDRFIKAHGSSAGYPETFDAFRDECLDLCELFPDLPESKALADRVKYLSAVGALQAAAHAR